MPHLRTFDDDRHIRQSLSGDDIDDISPCKCRRGDNIRHNLRTFDEHDDDDDDAVRTIK